MTWSDDLQGRVLQMGIIERLIRYWAGRRDGRVMSEQFAAGYRAGRVAGLREGREETRDGGIPQTPLGEVAGIRKTS